MVRSIIINLISTIILQIIGFLTKDFKEWKNRKH